MREFQRSWMIAQQKGQDESLTSNSSHLEAVFVPLRSSTGSSAGRCSLPTLKLQDYLVPASFASTEQLFAARSHAAGAPTTHCCCHLTGRYRDGLSLFSGTEWQHEGQQAQITNSNWY